jgi:hypothetical protein
MSKGPTLMIEIPGEESNNSNIDKQSNKKQTQTLKEKLTLPHGRGKYLFTFLVL